MIKFPFSLISLKDGEYIKIEREQETNFYIDSSQYISIVSTLDSKQNLLYKMILNDKFSGRQKDITSSKFYPISFYLSPKKNYISITMLDLSKVIDDNYYFSSIYLLSLSTYGLTEISTDGKSYMPKWSNKFIN